MDSAAIYRVISPIFRRSRMKAMARLVGLNDRHRVLDIGGTACNWAMLGSPRPDVVLSNIEAAVVAEPGFSAEVADARALPHPDRAFDLAFSNSVIEHVGTLDDQRRFAAEARRVATGYYVQTPCRWFPVEPHLIAPFVHWLPRRAYLRLARWMSLRWLLDRSFPVAATVAEVRLLSAREMRAIFPDAVLVRERFLGLTKSIIAYRRAV